jgi:hypothetical protein
LKMDLRPPQSPPRFQFSLRTALLLTPILAGLLFLNVLVVTKRNLLAVTLVDMVVVLAALIAWKATDHLFVWLLVFLFFVAVGLISLLGIGLLIGPLP